MTLVDDNVFPKLILAEGAAPGTPSASQVKLYAKADGLLYSKDDAGAETLVSGGAGGGSVATDAIWDAAGDLALGSGANTAARLAIGANGYVLTSNGTTAAWAAAAGGASRPYLDTLSLHGTYGDDFTGASLDAKWTQRGSAAHSFQMGGGTWLRMAHSSGASELIYQAAPVGDFEIVCSYSTHLPTVASMVGPMIVASDGSGVMACHYYSALNHLLGVLSAWAYSSGPQSVWMNDIAYESGVKVWVGLKKAGTAYSTRYSHDGHTWSPYSATSTQGFTVAYIGFGRHYGADASAITNLDVFNVI